MNTPGMHHIPFRAKHGDAVHIYSDATRIFLQLRHETPTGSADQDFLTASFKATVALTDSTALAIASELLSIVVSRQKALPNEEESIRRALIGATAPIKALQRIFLLEHVHRQSCPNYGTTAPVSPLFVSDEFIDFPGKSLSKSEALRFRLVEIAKMIDHALHGQLEKAFPLPL